MSDNNTTIPPYTGGTSSVTLIPSLQAVMIGHTFLVLLVPLLAALFYYSTPYSRRQPIFILNVLGLTLAFSLGIISEAVHLQAVMSPLSKWSPQLQITIGFMGICQTILVDSTLLVRLITVHPLSRIGPVRFALLTSLPILLKATRVINLILYIHQLSAIASGPNASQRTRTAWTTLPYVKIDWIAQMADNSYASIAFLWTIRGFQADTTSGELMSAVSFRQSSFARRIRILSRLALSNFIIPTLISIIQLVLLFRFGATNTIVVNDVAYVNALVSVFGVVFATVWAGKEHRREANAPQNLFQSKREQRYRHGLEATDTSCGGTASSVSDRVDVGVQVDDFMGGRDSVLPLQTTRGYSPAFRHIESGGLLYV